MRLSLQLVVNSISRENWEKAADAAARIVSHPQPSDSEKTRISRFLARTWVASNRSTHKPARLRQSWNVTRGQHSPKR